MTFQMPERNYYHDENRYQKRAHTDMLFIHCAATRPDQDIDADTVRTWHLNQGWFDIGYHYFIQRDGTLECGRPEWAVGAHVKGYNNRSIGVCMAGGINASGDAENNFTSEQWNTLINLIKYKNWQKTLKIRGHNEVAAKACPSFDVQFWVKSMDWDNVPDDNGDPSEPQDPVERLEQYVYLGGALPTIYKIAQTFGFPTDAVLAANPDIDPMHLQEGEKIYLPIED